MLKQELHKAPEYWRSSRVIGGGIRIAEEYRGATGERENASACGRSISRLAHT